MYVKAIIILCIIIILLVVYLSCRGRTNGSGIQDDRDSVDKLRNGTKSATDINNTLKGNTETGQDITGDIEQHNTNARSGIGKALDILRKARNRNNT